MRSHKLLFASATMLAATSAASLSFADDARPPSTPPSDAQPTGATGSSTTSSSTGMTPSAPSTPTTSPQGTPGAATSTTMPTSTTTTTSADDVVAVMPPPTAPAQPRETVTVYQRSRPNTPILITGGALLIGTYVTTAAFTANNGPIGDKDLYIPVVGPWINLANRSCAGECPNETRDTVLIAGSGVLQGIGAALVVTSFFIPNKIPAARITAGPVKMNLTPTAGMNSGGLGAVGTF